MTKLEVKIKKKEIIPPVNTKVGAYLATNSNPDDRIIFFSGPSKQKVVTVLNALYNGAFHMQENQSAHMYTNLKKIKKITVEVELE